MRAERNIILAGFMATGKSSVGKRLAARLGQEFVDLDALIEARAGMAIPAIFRAQGEAAFRALESQAARAVAARQGCVVATGGGAIVDPENLRAFQQSGVVITLTADVETILGRIGEGSDRPMLRDADKRERIQLLMAERAPAYARADFVVDTSSKNVAGVVEEIVVLLCGMVGVPPVPGAGMETVRVDLGGRGYAVHVGSQLLRRLGELVGPLRVGRRIGLVTHPILLTTHGYAEQVRQSLQAAGHEVVLLTVPEGEESKSLHETARLARELVRARLDRGSALIALGGGVLGDLVGFVAATLYRGVAFVNIPTTLLAQLDSSVGGKTGVNLPEGKNLIGAFHQPSLVVADVDTLQTLPEREFRSGLAELVKHAMIADAALFGRLEAEVEAISARRPAVLQGLVARSIAIKAHVVESDERELGLRAILNFGHTVGHALEAASGYGKITHGEGVAFGMLAATLLSVRRGLCPPDDFGKLRRLLSRLGLLAAKDLKLESLEKYIVRDKKVRDEVIQFVLTPGIGGVTLQPVSDLEEVRAALTELGARLQDPE